MPHARQPELPSNCARPPPTIPQLLIANDNALREQKLVLDLGKQIYTKKGTAATLDEPMSKDKTQMAELMALSEFATTSSSLLGQVSGVIKADQVAALERTLFRATRGNAVFESHEIETPLLDGALSHCPRVWH